MRTVVRMKNSTPRTEPERSEWVKFQLRVRGLSMADVSRSLNCERSTARKVFERRYPAVEARIAELLGCSPADIWPERYVDGIPVVLSTGRPKKVSPHADRNTTRPSKRLKKGAR